VAVGLVLVDAGAGCAVCVAVLVNDAVGVTERVHTSGGRMVGTAGVVSLAGLQAARLTTNQTKSSPKKVTRSGSKHNLLFW